MGLSHRALKHVFIGIIAAASLGLAGCFGSTEAEQLALPNATIAPPSITQEGTLRVGVDSSHAPFAGLSDGKTVGIDVDVAAALSERMGLKLEVVDIRDQEMSALLKEGTVDVIMGVQGDAATAFSEAQVGPYLVDGPAIFTVGLTDEPQGFSSEQLDGMKIVAQEGSLSAWQVGKEYGEANLLTYPSLNNVFDELAAGTVSYAAADAVVGSFLAVQYENIRCEGLLSDLQGVYLGVATEKQELATALTEALKGLRDDGSLQVIVAKWLGPVSAQTVLSTQAIVSLTPGDTSATTTDGGTTNAATGDSAATTTTDDDTAAATTGDGAVAATTGDGTGEGSEGFPELTSPSNGGQGAAN
jgi:polar amino acid transport system substrate-binding protein